MSIFSSANITDGNLVLKECTHRIKIKYSMHLYSVHLDNLGNWLISHANYYPTIAAVKWHSQVPVKQR